MHLKKKAGSVGPVQGYPGEARGSWHLSPWAIPIHSYKYAYFQLPATFEHTYPKTPSPQKKRDFKRRIFADLKTTEYDS